MSVPFLTKLVMLTYIFGIAHGSLTTSPYHFTSWLTCLTAGLFFIKYRIGGLGILLLLSGAALGGSWYATFWRSQYFAHYSPGPISFTGTVVEAPDPRADKVFLVVQPDSQKGRIRLSTKRYPTFRYNDRVQITGTLQLPEPFSNFNYPLFLEVRHIYATIPRAHVSLVERTRAPTLHGSLYLFREHLQAQLSRFVPEPEVSFLGGILLGSKQAIPETIQEELRLTGTTHIVAVSGANITILLAILLRVLPLYSLHSQAFGTVASASFMSILTGGSASVVRGATVASFSQYIRSRSRRANPTAILLLAAVCIITINPLFLIGDPSFQLSFSAYAGLLYCGTPFQHCLQVKPLVYLPQVVRSALAETAAATIGTIPVVLYYFGTLSLLGLLVNPLILWILPAITSLGLVLIGLGWWTPLGEYISLPLTLLLHLVLETIHFFSQYGH